MVMYGVYNSDTLEDLIDTQNYTIEPHGMKNYFQDR